jgi:HPt (histidine-containing phosphotransfer) domain-containing protein
MSSQFIIDLPTFEALKESVGEDFIDELLQAYFEETPQLLVNLQQALTRQDSEAFRLAAHSIKSTSNSFGALQFGELARELEMMGREGNIMGASEKVEALVTGYENVRLALEGLNHGKQ